MATQHELKKKMRQQEKKDINLEVFSKKNQREGLCKDCVRAEDCTLSHNTKDVIWDCEDYDNLASQELHQTRTEPKAEKVTAKSKPGLCPYCAYKDSCSLKSVEGGIWHCAEYA